jgi:ribosomal protein S18 acetylase RimI-like enzyme
MSFPEIRPAREDELTAVGNLISYSFDHLDADSYLVPNEADRLKVMADFFGLLTEHAYKYGQVDIIDAPSGEGYAATAVWFDLTREAPGPERYEERLEELAGQYLPRFQALDELFEKHHPTDPHWHLAFLAVHPEHQAHGLGSLLMNAKHEELDQAGVPAYLEATNANNIRLYKRHGYTEMEPYDILLPDGTPFFRMWRPAS